MNFVFPYFLWALGALSIPVIIHLFNFRKATRVFFSNNRLLRQIKEETTQKRKLKQFLVLASRLLFVFFLVLAFAQPYLPAKEQVTSGRNIILYLDNSFSMTAQISEKIRALDAGIGFIREITDLFPPDTQYKLITNDFAPFSNNFRTKTEILDLLAQIRPTAVSRTINEVQQRIGPNKPGAEIFWIADFQKSTSGLADNFKADSLAQWHLLPILLGQSSNVLVDTVYLENPFVIGGDRNSVTVRLRNIGARRLESLVVKLIINNVQNGAVSVDIEPNSFTEASFDLASGITGLNEAKISFTDFPVSFDNEFYFTLNFTERIRVVEIKHENTQVFVDRVFGNRQLFNYQGFLSENVDYSLLEKVDLLVINGLNTVDPALSGALTSFRENLGALLLIPGNQPTLNDYKKFIPNSNLSLTPTAEMSALDPPDFKNPFFENVFEERTMAMQMPQAIPLLNWGPDRSAILKFKDNRPFLSRQANVFLLASPLQQDYTNFHNHALFVPVMYRIAASAKKAEQNRYYTLSDNLISIPADSIVGEEPLHLTGSQEVVPSQRRIGNHILLEIPKFYMTPGFYHVLHQKDTLGLIAINLDSRESDLSQHSPEELITRFGGGRHVSLFEISDTAAFSNEIKARYLGTPLWKQALILALLFLLAEVLLIRYLK